MTTSTSDIDYLERELRKELEEFDNLLANDTTITHTSSMTAYELAEAEGEKEAMQDRLHLLQASLLSPRIKALVSDHNQLYVISIRIGLLG
jgi:hypothetical protein